MALELMAKERYSDYHGVSISAGQYRRDKFVMAIQTSKLLAAGFTGINTRSGDLMTIKSKVLDSAIPAEHMPSALHVVLEADQILEIRDTGVQVFD